MGSMPVSGVRPPRVKCREMHIDDSQAGEGEWYVVGPGQKPFGPYSLAKLRQYVADGRIQPSTLVHARGSETWIQAGQVPSLFAQDPSSMGGTPPTERSNVVVPVSSVLMCPTCKAGYLSRMQPYRLSMPVVIIGYLLLVPSFLGIIISVIGTAFVMLYPLVSGIDARDANQVSYSGVAALFSAFNGICLIVGFFIAGLLGWLLIMKRTVLRCNLCGATIDAY